MNNRLPSRHRRNRYEVPPEMRASNPPQAEDPHLVDERRLFYVAVTRARDLLVIGTADVVNKRGGGPSIFLHEMLGDDPSAGSELALSLSKGQTLQATADVTGAHIAEVESQPESRRVPRERHSFSQLAYFLQCPMRYKFAVIYGLGVPWLDPVDFGANVHRALEAVHQRVLAGHTVTVGEVEGIVAETWVPSRRTRPEREREYQAAAVNQLRRYLREHGEALSRVLQAETTFSLDPSGWSPRGRSLADRVLLGKIDLLRRDGDGGVEVVDFKTSAMVPPEAERIDLQLDLYALGAEVSLGQPVTRQTVHFLGDGQVVTWAWSPRRKTAARVQLTEVLDRIDREAFPPNTAYCARCQEFQAICPYYTPEQAPE